MLRLVRHRLLQVQAAFRTYHHRSRLGVYARIQQTHALEYYLGFRPLYVVRLCDCTFLDHRVEFIEYC